PNNTDDSNKSNKTHFLETNDCLVCDFKFASFVSPQIYYFQHISTQNEIPYQFITKEILISFSITTLFLRGPPALV
ncbi:MAG TPA: hypothetical protein DDZ41_05780, partial [Flavobacterium sp.]|nr:hypothetical protein [Flavobacterium sp.]